MMATKALAATFGVEVTGDVDLTDDTVVARLTEALRWRGVLVVRGLHLDDEAQLAFSRRFGEVVQPRTGMELMTVSLDPAVSRSAEYLHATLNWHIDDTCSDVPAKVTVLTCRQPAATGGGTEFASTYAAYEALPEAERKRYEGLRVLHSFEAAQRTACPDPTDEQLAGWRTLPTHESSLIWERRDGRRSLVIGATADHVVGMDPVESRALLDEVQEWATQERFCHTHEWEAGDMVVWDNTGMLHRALPYDASSERLMRRSTVVGDEPWT
ncbi:TauD/TfdA dioxygenase family protein [Rhodococcus sp. NPDC003322]